MVLRPDMSLKTFCIDPVFIFLSKLFLPEQHWFSPNNQQCLSTLIGSVKSFLVRVRARAPLSKNSLQTTSIQDVSAFIVYTARSWALVGTGIGRPGELNCQSDGRVCSFTLIIRTEWRLEGVKQTTFICFPTQSLSKWPLLGFHCNRIPPTPWSWVTAGLMQSQSGMALRGERGESAATNPLPCWGDAQQMGHSRNRGTSSLAVLWSY